MGCGGYDVLCCKVLFFSPTFALVTLASVQLAGSCDSATVEASSLVQDGTWVEPIPSKASAGHASRYALKHDQHIATYRLISAPNSSHGRPSILDPWAFQLSQLLSGQVFPGEVKLVTMGQDSIHSCLELACNEEDKASDFASS